MILRRLPISVRLEACLVLLAAGLVLAGVDSSAQAQPRLEASVSEDRPRAGEPFTLRLDVQHEESIDRYVFYPPQLELPSSITQGPVTQGFHSQGKMTIYQYVFSLTASAPGPLELGKASVDYRDLQSASTEKPPPLEVVLPPLTVAQGGAGGALARALPVVLGLAAIVAVFVWRRRRVRALDTPAPVAQVPTAESFLEDVRRSLVAGSLDRAYEQLIALKPMLPPEQDPLPSAEQLEAERLRVRYGGVRGVQPELERLVRAVEVLIKPSRHETCTEEALETPK